MPDLTEKAIPDASEELVDLDHVEAGGTLPATNPDSSEALDNLLKLVQEEDGGDGDAAAAKKKADDDAAAAKKKADDDAAEAKKNAPALTEDEAAAKKKADDEAAEKAKADEAAAKARVAPADFQKIELPPYVKPKAAEAFAQVKLLAQQQIDSLTSQLSEAKDNLSKAEAKVKETQTTKLAPEVEKELKELREFRQKLDVESDPEFKSFDANITANDEGIYERLKKAGLDDDALKKIKELGGPAEVDWEVLNGKLPAQVRRYIEGKLFENETLAEKKRQAIEKAKTNSEEYLKSRKAQVSQDAEQVIAQTHAEVDKLLPQLPWINPKDIPADATPEARKEIEERNAHVAKIREDMKEAANDNSPNMRAILVVAFGQLLKSRADFAAKEAKFKATEEALSKELKETKDLVNRIKKGSTTRLRESTAPAPGEVKITPKVDITEHGGDALDRLRAEAEAAKE